MNELSSKQLSIMIFFIPLVFKAAMLPSLLYEECGADFYIGIGIITVLELLQLALILKILSLGGLNAVGEKYGSLAKKLLSIPFLLSMVVKSLIFITEIYAYVTQYLFYNISPLPIICALLIALFYLALKGPGAVGRIFELAVWLVPVIILFGIFFGKAKLCGDYLAPLFVSGGKSMLVGLDKYFVYTFDFSPLLFFKIKKIKKSSVLISSALSLAAVVGVYIIFLASYGRASFLISQAFARLASFNTVISEIGALDWPSALLWLTAGTCNIALKFCAVAEIGSLFKVKRQVSLGGSLLLCGGLLLFLLDTVKKTLDFVVGPVRYAVVFADVVIPIAIFLLLLIKKGEKEALREQKN